MGYIYDGINDHLVGGWPTPLKNDGVNISWDDEIPNWMESHKKMFKPPTRIGYKKNLGVEMMFSWYVKSSGCIWKIIWNNHSFKGAAMWGSLDS